jgi:dipeptidyl aminopeptidase/acylaminoacyl peptidase
MHMKRLFAFGISLVLFPVSSQSQEQPRNRRAVQPSDCVQVRHFFDDAFRSSIVINPKGTDIAYLVQSPNLEANRNDVELFVTAGTGNSTPVRLLSSSDMSGLHWLDDGSAVTVLTRSADKVVLERIDVPSGKAEVLVQASQDIAEYSISGDGKTAVFVTEIPESSLSAARTQSEISHGYRIPLQKEQVALFPKREVFVTRRTPENTWSMPTPVYVRSPFTGQALKELPYVLNLRLSLAPNGEKLALTYLENASRISDAWKQSRSVKALISSIGMAEITSVTDLKSGQTTLPFQGPWAYTVPLWSTDSTSFIIGAVSPVNSEWERQDVAENRMSDDTVHLFQTDVRTGETREVLKELGGILAGPLSWPSNDVLLLRTGDSAVSRFELKDGHWVERERTVIPLQHFFKNADLASNGVFIVGDYETPAIPPELFIYRPGDSAAKTVARLNPQLDDLTLATIKDIDWITSSGFHASGLLFIPPGYKPGERYPLVIHSYPSASNFFCDSGLTHEPSFAPQPIATAGIMYLIRILPDGSHTEDEVSHYPKGYPGNIAEAAFQADVWDSAVDYLAKKGMVDPNRVGIIGFSRSGWYTEFALTHGRTRYAAATAADNTQYSLGEYWMVHSDGLLHSWDAMYGGPPYGDTLQNWEKYSISFNLPKIHTPLLMEVMGYGHSYDNDNTPPSNLVLKSEVFAGLGRLGNPVEMYYYPLEEHQPNHPQARLSSMQRNLDWYRFWLLNYDRPNPEDPDQYTRWRGMRDSSIGGASR